MRDLQMYARQCVSDLKSIGYNVPPIEFKQNGRLAKTWGYCRTQRNKGVTYKCTIDIATFLLDESIDDKILRNTLYHEIAHAIDDNRHGHSGQWLQIADTISDCYNMNITQYVQQEEKLAVKDTQLYKAKYKTYVYVCQKCGKEIRETKSRAPKQWGMNSYIHTKCNGRLTDWKVE